MADGNRGFSKWRILHRRWAVLVCQEAHIIDPTVRDVYATIVGTRREEDDPMQEVLKRYE